MLLIVFVSSCRRDQVEENIADCPEEVTYDDDTRLILNTYCAYSGCHDGVIKYDYTNYDAMKDELDDGSFLSRVINIQDMPPTYANEGFKTLTPEALTLLTCWEQAGFPEF